MWASRRITFLLEVKLPYDTVCPSVGCLVGWSVCHIFVNGRQVSLPCSYQSTYLIISNAFIATFLLLYLYKYRNDHPWRLHCTPVRPFVIKAVSLIVYCSSEQDNTRLNIKIQNEIFVFEIIEIYQFSYCRGLTKAQRNGF